eukprot:TRINITY_DN22523_c0_g1_i1.p2 TRINITY_DN22523_c0_g1~~TRINITY_DN22523_c0_g1_i1.p2  ORF type:complete len:161 (+),score=61.15 TRINITY_DN22523_c0_g1_i1:73-555(+)
MSPSKDHAGAAPAYDIWRDSSLRYAGYVNEFGEAFRPLIPKSAVVASYVVAIGYAAGDSLDKGKAAYDQHGFRKGAQAGFTAALWQTLASVTIPAFFVNRQVAFTRSMLGKMSKPAGGMLMRFGPTFSGLALIPVMPYLLDPPVDFVVEKVEETIFGKDA